MDLSKILVLLAVVHMFFIVRYCVGSIVRNAKKSTAEYCMVGCSSTGAYNRLLDLLALG
jgi:hypothetical protein